MKISIVVEGKTEQAFAPVLRDFLRGRLEGSMPRLDFVPQDGRIPTGDKLRRLVSNLLTSRPAAQEVIALTDVYTGKRDFENADVAKSKMRKWVGPEPHFHPHVALHDFEAWLLPYWPKIPPLAGSNRTAPKGDPESVNHDNPPAHRIAEVFLTGSRGRRYVKPRDGAAILRGQDLMTAADACTELKAMLNTILTLCGGAPID